MLPKKLFKSKKGIVGIEAAIVLIAFIIIAAALSYVVINMGFYTTQKTKETMQSGLAESLTALQLDGLVTAKTNQTSTQILYILVPVKLAAGHASIDLSNSSVIVSVYLPNATLLNIYKGVHPSTTNTTWDDLSTTLGLSDNEAKFAIYNDNGNTVLESTEKAFLMIRLNSNSTTTMLNDYDTMKVEVRSATGAALTVVRTAPGGMIANSFVDLG
ncbi:MAG: flagellin [Candidatus Bathyarchaeota archaeon]|nr:flagellin [Candidatus Bathyarchaeota archaeon]